MMVIYSTDPEMAITHSGLFWSMQDWSRMSAYLKSSSIHDLFHDAADGPAHRCVKKYIWSLHFKGIQRRSIKLQSLIIRCFTLNGIAFTSM